MITLKTSMGDIVIELDHEKAPKSCENFEQYVRDGHYDLSLIHISEPTRLDARSRMPSSA